MDLISRRGAIDAIQNQAIHTPEELNDIGIAYYEGLHYAFQVISMLPSAEPERKRGRYIKGKNGEWYCSECKRIDDKYSVANFCWYCGADMRGGQDEHID